MADSNTSRIRSNPRDTTTPPKGQPSRIRSNPRNTTRKPS